MRAAHSRCVPTCSCRPCSRHHHLRPTVAVVAVVAAVGASSAATNQLLIRREAFMKNYLVIAAASSLAWLGVPRIAGAVNGPSPGAVTPQTVKLPDGPGSVRGLASDATVNTFTGQV